MGSAANPGVPRLLKAAADETLRQREDTHRADPRLVASKGIEGAA